MLYNHIDPFKETDIKVLQDKLNECQRALTWATFGENLYSKWCNRLLAYGYVNPKNKK